MNGAARYIVKMRHCAPDSPSNNACARIGAVRILLKSLIVWLMLLAIPLQGFASATMLVCAPMPPASSTVRSASTMPHDHQRMVSAAGGEAHHHPVASRFAPDAQLDAGDQTAGHHAGGKCNACATCYFGASMAPPCASRVPAEIQRVASTPSDVGHIGSVDLALPERPPQTSLA